ncbi:MAG: DUF6629 family protein [Actinomycetes bacterium]
MCFSIEGDLIGGAAVVAIGIDACRHLKAMPEYRFVAILPVVLGLHQIDEAFVWLSLQGRVPESVGNVSMWIYLVFALVILPVLAPLLVLSIEPTQPRRRRIVPFILLGVAVAILMAWALLSSPPTAHLGAYHLAYSIGLSHGIVITGLYIVATCGPMLVSEYRHVVLFGFANLIALVTLARLCANGFASLWCFYAALTSGAIALYLRFGSRPSANAAHAGGSPSPLAQNLESETL